MSEQAFKTVFGYAPDAHGFTPGRVNLIGEHIDYNGGMVLPTALDLGVTITLAPSKDNVVKIWSDKFDNIAERNLSDTAIDHWSDYILGAVSIAHQEGLLTGGADIAATTTLPFGAGISSSAAVTVGVLKAVRNISGAAISDKDIAVLARRVENDFIGMPCGIMDQMAVAIARPGQALTLDTETLEYDLVNLPADYHIAVIHSGVFRQLNEGQYKIRKEECDAVKAQLGHENICRISDTEFAALSALPDTLYRRVRHCMTEHRRTVEAAACLKDNNISRFGALMNESHISMRDDFEMSVLKVDALVRDAVKFGAVGARLTGGGFGGCIVACVANEILPVWKNELLKAHPDAFWVS